MARSKRRTIRHKKVVRNKNKEIAALKKENKLMRAALQKSSRKELVKEIDETNKVVKKNQKINVRVWLLTSSFAIASCIFGLTNLILNIIDKVKN